MQKLGVSQPHHAENDATDAEAMTVVPVMTPWGLAAVVRQRELYTALRPT
ncbi:MAG: hypothetical protein KGR71_20265 [Proteobacteria bacterium]|nr:hypothetical protein [Pseudomonadota bacterium]